MGKVYTTTNLEETQNLASELTKKLKGGDMLALHGDLGSGKTTFVQGLAKGLGITQRIISPTFVIVKKYELSLVRSHLASVNDFYHVDLYRTESAKDIQGLGLEEIMNSSENIIAIEWAEKLGDLLPKKRWDIMFEYLSENKRKIRILSNNLNH